MWIVWTSSSSSMLLPQSFTLCPSHLGCPPYSVNYDLTTTSLQIRSSSLSGFLAHLIPESCEGLLQARCMLVPVLSCLETEKLAGFHHPRLEGVMAVTNAVWYHASSVGSWMVKKLPISTCTNICPVVFNCFTGNHAGLMT